MKKGFSGIVLFLFCQNIWASGMDELKTPKLFQQVGAEWVEVFSPKSIDSTRKNYVERLSVGEIVTIGELVWEIVKENEPILNFESERLGVLPKGVTSAKELTQWQTPVTSKYKVVYENVLGFEMVNFQYRLIFTPGGEYKGKGQYLTNVAIEPISVEVSFGYEMNARFEALDIINLGDEENLLAGLELQLTWSVDTLVKKSIHQSNFFISGNGGWQQL